MNYSHLKVPEQIINKRGRKRWEKQNVSHDHSLQDGTGLIAIIVGTAIIRITVISARG